MNDFMTGSYGYNAQTAMSGMPRFNNQPNGQAYQNSYIPMQQQYNSNQQQQQQQYQPQQAQQPIQPQAPQGITCYWVNGYAGAQAFSVAPNNRIVLFDSDDDFYYVKSADANGMATIVTYSFEEIENSSNKKLKKGKKDEEEEKPTQDTQYVTIAMAQQFYDKIQVLEKEINDIKNEKMTIANIPPKKQKNNIMAQSNESDGE